MTFEAKVTDEYGIPSPEAQITVFNCSRTYQETLSAKEGDINYTEDDEIKAIAYNANYWHNKETKAAGFRSKPLRFTDENGNFDNLFVADIKHPEAVSILEGNLNIKQKTLQVIRTDLIRRFS